MKTCSACRAEKSLADFHVDRSRTDGRQRICRPCKTKAIVRRQREDPAVHADKQRAWSKANPEAVREIRARQERDPKHVAARRAVHEEIRRGSIIRPDSCEDCGCLGATHAHHDDYDRPLDVRFLCPPCHLRVHGKASRLIDPAVA